MAFLLLLALQDWDAGELEMDRQVTRVFELDSPARQVVAGCPCFTTRLLDDRRLEVTLSTRSLIGANTKPVHVVHDGDKTTRLMIRFDVTTTNRVERPQLALHYVAVDETVLRLYELAQKRNCTFEVRAAERLGRAVDDLELRDGDRTWKGRAAVLDALKRLRADAGLDPPPPDPLPSSTPGGDIVVYFFYSRHCGECPKLVEKTIQPAFAARPKLRLVSLDVSANDVNLRQFLGVIKQYGQRENTMPGLLAGNRYLGGFDAIRAGIDAALDGAVPVTPMSADPAEAYAGIKLGALVLAGLVDGLNPCAFATAVLLASFLASRKRPLVDIVLAGGLFTMAVFATYLAIGYGLVAVATRLTGTAVAVITAAVAVVLAIVSVRDAVVFARTGDASRVALQMPDAVKRHVHGAMGRMRAALALGSISAGIVVTLLEAVCTGQLYVPVIVAMTRQSTGAHAMLVLYNVAFVVPLLVVLACAIAGVKSPRLVEWTRRNVVAGKIAMAVLFVAMAVWLLLGL